MGHISRIQERMVSTSKSVTYSRMAKGLTSDQLSLVISAMPSQNFKSTSSQGKSGQVKEMDKEKIRERRYVLHLDLI